MWEVVHSPEEAFSANESGPTYLVPFVVISLLYVILSLIQAPIQIEWMRAQMIAASAPPGEVDSSIQIMRRSLGAGAIVIPLLLMVRGLAHALLIWLTAQVFLIRLGFSQTLTVVSYAYIPVLLRDATVCLILCLRKPEVLVGSEGLNVAIGLNLIIPQIPAPWSALGANLNMFEFWFVALLVIGLGVLARERWQKTLAIVLPVWVFVTLLQFGFVSLGYKLKNQFIRG